ncbi:hypothetical protein TWF730_003776 [Orbilia blumenaviensis]|uniref:Uncharacterized protein n=1 Tax=Orbilia blumenaviensis TaxID=1796055 RepID=A0AAV9U7I9_9PEZI
MSHNKRPLSPPSEDDVKRPRARSIDSLPSLSQNPGTPPQQDEEDVSFVGSSPQTNLAANDLYAFARSLEYAECIYCRWTGISKAPDHSLDECTEQPEGFIEKCEKMVRGKCLCGLEHTSDPCALTRMAKAVSGLATVVDELRDDFSLCILGEWCDLGSYEAWCLKEGRWRGEIIPNPLRLLDSARELAEDEPKWRSKWVPEQNVFYCI